MSSQILSLEQTEKAQATLLVGRPLKRKEDPKILTGRTRYVDDINLPGMLHAAVLRSLYAHAMIKNVDISRALRMPGTRLVLTA